MSNRPSRPKRRNPNSVESRWQRATLAVSCTLFLLVGLVVPFLPSIDFATAKFVSGILLKVGMVLGFGWLAAPQLERLGWQRIRGTLLIGLILVIVLYAIRPKVGAIAGLILVGGSTFFALMGWIRKFTRP